MVQDSLLHLKSVRVRVENTIVVQRWDVEIHCNFMTNHNIFGNTKKLYLNLENG